VPKTQPWRYKKYVQNLVVFEILTTAVMKNFIFCDITPCSPLKEKRCFGEIFRLLLQGRRISQARNQLEVGSISPSSSGSKIEPREKAASSR
jgi:hypothetical protein